jgi:hypothetical protein
VRLTQGIPADAAKKIVKAVKEGGFKKTQAVDPGRRDPGYSPSRDELQAVIARSGPRTSGSSSSLATTAAERRAGAVACLLGPARGGHRRELCAGRDLPKHPASAPEPVPGYPAPRPNPRAGAPHRPRGRGRFGHDRGGAALTVSDRAGARIAEIARRETWRVSAPGQALSLATTLGHGVGRDRRARRGARRSRGSRCG